MHATIVYAADVGSSSWTESDSANTTTPAGWLANWNVAFTSRAECSRDNGWSKKRFYNHINGTQTSAGTANAQTLAYSVAPAAYNTGDIFTFFVGAGLTNSGATTLNINSLAAITVEAAGNALVGGELQAGQIVSVLYDGTNFQILSSAATAPYGTSFSGTRSFVWSGSSDLCQTCSLVYQNEDLSGTSSAGSGAQLSGNYHGVTDNVIVPQPIYALSNWDYELYMGATAQGARNVIKAFANVQTTPSVLGTPGNNYPAYVGVFPGGVIGVNLGGTSVSSIHDTAGSLYGMNPNVTLQGGATDIYAITDQENDMTVLSGASVAQKIGISVAEASTDAVQGSVADAAFLIQNQLGAIGWKCGFCFSGNGSGASFGINPSNGTMIGTIGSSGMSAVNGVDFSLVSFSGNAFASNNFAVSGTGALTAVNLQWYGHLLPSTGVTPTAIPTFSCGTGCTATGTDSDGIVYPGSAVSTVTITFKDVFPSVPACTFAGIGTSAGVLTETADSASAISVGLYAPATNSLTNFTGTDGFNYHCMD